MAYTRLDMISNENEIQNIEDAHFVLLSLYREYSVRLLKNASAKEDCITKMRQIKKDMRYLDKQELLNKVRNIYIPLIKSMTKEH